MVIPYNSSKVYHQFMQDVFQKVQQFCDNSLKKMLVQRPSAPSSELMLTFPVNICAALSRASERAVSLQVSRLSQRCGSKTFLGGLTCCSKAIHWFPGLKNMHEMAS